MASSIMPPFFANAETLNIPENHIITERIFTIDYSNFEKNIDTFDFMRDAFDEEVRKTQEKEEKSCDLDWNICQENRKKEFFENFRKAVIAKIQKNNITFHNDNGSIEDFIKNYDFSNEYSTSHLYFAYNYIQGDHDKIIPAMKTAFYNNYTSENLKENIIQLIPSGQKYTVPPDIRVECQAISENTHCPDQFVTNDYGIYAKIPDGANNGKIKLTITYTESINDYDEDLKAEYKTGEVIIKSRKEYIPADFSVNPSVLYHTCSPLIPYTKYLPASVRYKLGFE